MDIVCAYIYMCIYVYVYIYRERYILLYFWYIPAWCESRYTAPMVGSRAACEVERQGPEWTKKGATI